MALRRITLRDFVIVQALELELGLGFTVLTGETGAGKSILIDALQLALGSRSDAGMVREGCSNTDVCAEFDCPPHTPGPGWKKQVLKPKVCCSCAVRWTRKEKAAHGSMERPPRQHN